MLSDTYYAHTYASIIGGSLLIALAVVKLLVESILGRFEGLFGLIVLPNQYYLIVIRKK